MDFDVLYRKVFLITLQTKLDNKVITLNDVRDLYYLTNNDTEAYKFQEHLAYREILVNNGYNFRTRTF